MYDINLKNVKKGKIFFRIFFGIGLLFLVVVTVVFILVGKSFNYESSTEATDIEITSHYDSDSSLMYSPIFHYNVNGKEYTCNSGTSTSLKPNIKNKTIYYESSDPSKCISAYDKNFSYLFYLFYLLPVVFIIIGYVGISKVNKRIKLINELNTKGKLVKNIPFVLEPSNYSVNNRRIMRPVIDYKLPNGEELTLYGDPKFDLKETDDDGLVDLVIDELNPSNYFIDYEINRIGGNKDSDYYKSESINNEEIKYGVDESQFK